MIQVLLVALGGAVGAVMRYLTALATARIIGKSRVLTGTVVANSIGCLLGGILLGWVSVAAHPGENIVLFLSIGILGSYTTFSTFSLELSRLLRKPYSALITYLLLQMVVVIGLAAFGYLMVIWLAGGIYG